MSAACEEQDSALYMVLSEIMTVLEIIGFSPNVILINSSEVCSINPGLPLQMRCFRSV
jgi:hypothetical protein